jgi:phage host-nuclease inhibitor protein Gam
MDEANRVAIRLRQTDRKIETATNRCKKLSTDLKKAQGRKSELEKQREKDQELLRAFSDPRRDELTEGGKRKSFRFPCGVIGQWGFPSQVSLVVGGSLLAIAKKLLERPDGEKYVEIKLKKTNIKANLDELGIPELHLPERTERFWAKT